MTRYEKQPDGMPTNKALTAASIAAVVTTYAQPVAAELWPQVAPAALAGPAMTGAVAALVGAMAALIVAWWVPDRAGVTP
jgi:hypothetical protein